MFIYKLRLENGCHMPCETSQPRSACIRTVTICRTLDKREYLMIIQDNFSYFSMKTYVVTPHLNRLVKMVEMRGNNIAI